MPIQQDDVIKAVWQYEVAGEVSLAQNVFHWQVTDLVSATDNDVLTDLITHLEALYTNINADLSSDYGQVTVRATNETRKEFVGENDSVFQGTGADDGSTSPQVCVEVLARSRTLGHVGRKYIGPVIEASITNGTLIPVSQAAFEAFAEDWEDTFAGIVTGNTYTPGTAQYGPGGGLTGFRPFVAGLSFVQPRTRTMRSRTPGFGVG